MAVSGVGGVGAVGGVNLSQLAEMYRRQVADAQPAGPAGPAGTAGTGQATGTAARGADFAGAVGQSLSDLGTLDRTAGDKAVKAATGDLTDIHDYVIAATQAQMATELTTTVRNKALDAFNEIMRMPL
jgi:flagellar hook-basal body complex protein FliE